VFPKIQKLKHKILGTWLRLVGILQLSLQRDGGPTTSAVCYYNLI